MATVEMLNPAIIALGFQREKGDSDYGTCMWAIFFIDTENYDLQVMSDCGEYAYGWYPTPEVESFLKLLSRINESYLLDKICYCVNKDYPVNAKKIVEVFMNYIQPKIKELLK